MVLDRIRPFIVAAVALAGAARLDAQCYISYGLTEGAKPNKLYLYFPTASDSTFPSITSGGVAISGVTPARAFNVSDLDSTIGTTAQLRDAIFTIVKSDYCEFNVQVLSTTTSPASLPSPPARRLTVAVGSDTHPSLYGLAREDDLLAGNDATVIDFARVWAGSYLDVAGGPGGELNGANSTLDRWANGIGGTAAHEAAHTYSLVHTTAVRTGEDAFSRHIMPAGTSLTVAQRVGGRRHFSDVEYGVLAAQVGLSVQTVHNWDFTNPNSAEARSLRMEILSNQSTLTLGWHYTGLRTPWINPTITSLGTTTFRGTTYNRFRVTWSSGQAWSNSGSPPLQPSGTVAAGGNFHIGATFVGVDTNLPDPIIVRDVTLHDSSGTALPQHPRMVGYDAGGLDARDGTFRLRLFAADGGPLEVRDIRVLELPRVLAIESMLTGEPMRTWDGLPVVPWRERTFGNATVRDELVLDLATLKRGHNILLDFRNQQRPEGPVIGAADSRVPPEVNDVAGGIRTDLFPSTTVYLTATVVDPDVEHWDPSLGRMVRGPVESKLFYQFRGITPDLNRNGVDDVVDVYTGASPDANGNGVPDDGESAAGGGSSRWMLYPFVGRFRFDDDLLLDDGTVYGVRLARNTSPLSLEGEVGVTPASPGRVIQASVNARRFFGTSAAVRPFVIAGAGGLFFRDFVVNDSTVAINGGVGLDVLCTPTLRLRFDLRDIVALDAYGTGTTHNWQFTAGVGFPLP